MEVLDKISSTGVTKKRGTVSGSPFEMVYISIYLLMITVLLKVSPLVLTN